MGWPFQNEQEFEAHLKKKIDDAIKKERSKNPETRERFSKLYKEDAENLGTISVILDSINKQTNL